MDRYSAFGQMAGGSGVIEMDVRDQTRIEILDRQTVSGQSCSQLSINPDRPR